MGRRKLPMELIADESSRKKSLKVRKEGVIKKAHELKTLCGVHDTCVIIYDNQNPDLIPTTYPENQDRVKQIVGRYLSANRTVMMKNKKENATQERKLEKIVTEDDVIGNLSWQELKCLDDTLAAREVAATRKLEEARRTRLMIRRRMQQQQQQQLYNLLMMDEDDGIGEGDMAALNDVMLDYSSLI